jgi:hypothetical protein
MTVFRLARASSANSAVLIRDAAGRLVRTLAVPPAKSSVAWNRADDAGRSVEPGVYFAAQRNGDPNLVVKLVVTR